MVATQNSNEVPNGDMTSKDLQNGEEKKKDEIDKRNESVEDEGNKNDKKKEDEGSKGDKKEDEESFVPGEVCEIRSIRQRINKLSGEPQTFEMGASKGRPSYDRYAVVKISSVDPETKKPVYSVEINSPHILEVLKKVVTFYPGQPLDFEEQVVFKSPYMLLHHHYQELQDYYSACADEKAKEHVQLVLDFIRDEGAEHRKLLDSGLTSFKHVWALFKPGTLIYENKHGHESLMRITKVGYGEHPKAGKYIEIRMYFTHSDGEEVSTYERPIQLFEKAEYFVGSDSLSITSLPLYPIDYVDHQEELKLRLTKRGEEYLRIRGVNVFSYDGLHLFLKLPPDDYYDECSEWTGKWLPATCRTRIIVDAKLFVEEKSNSLDDMSHFFAPTIENSEETSELAEYNGCSPMLCPAYVYGFNLESKDWCKFFVDSLLPANWIPDALARLVLPEGRKNVIRSLVSAHQYPETNSLARDEARSKGLGLCFLLHGTPGSGKTLTAELVAEHTNRPLLNITTGELGSWTHSISFELKRLLSYAARWHAVVLIDEADVFLESRSTGSGDGGAASYDALSRNSLVAVFLRQLEYFQGIMFLTSNRVAVFDPAIRSRIHLALHYQPPDKEMRASLWQDKVKAIPANEKDLDASDLDGEIAEATMNGRDISNAVNTARTLARDSGGKLKLSHIKTVVALWRDFEDLMDSLQTESSSTEKVTPTKK